MSSVPRRVLVTGATGCLGGGTARYLAGVPLTHSAVMTDGGSTGTMCPTSTQTAVAPTGVAVTATGRSREAGARLTEEGITFVPADLTDPNAVDHLVAGHDTVIHCGGLSFGLGAACLSSYGECAWDAARGGSLPEPRCQRRLVFVSTPSLYDTSRRPAEPAGGCTTRRSTHERLTASKLASERLIRDAAKQGLGTVIVRPRAIFGPHDRALLPRLLRVTARGWLR